MWWMATRSGPVHLRDLYKVVTPHAAASAASFAAIIILRHAAIPDTIPGLAACLCTSYAVAFLVLGLIPSGRMTLRESMSLVSSILRGS